MESIGIGVGITKNNSPNAKYLQDIAYNSESYTYFDKKGNMNPTLVDVPVAKFTVANSDYIILTDEVKIESGDILEFWMKPTAVATGLAQTTISKIIYSGNFRYSRIALHPSSASMLDGTFIFTDDSACAVSYYSFSTNFTTNIVKLSLGISGNTASIKRYDTNEEKIITFSKPVYFSFNQIGSFQSNRFFGGNIFGIKKNGVLIANLQEFSGSKIFSPSGEEIGTWSGSGPRYERVSDIASPHQSADLKKVTHSGGVAYVPATVADTIINTNFTGAIIETLSGLYKDDGSRMNLHPVTNNNPAGNGQTISGYINSINAANPMIDLNSYESGALLPDEFKNTIYPDKSTTIMRLLNQTPSNIDYQGLIWDSVADTYERTGSIRDIATGISAGNANLPIQSQMKRCTLLNTGVVNYFLDSDETLNKVGEGFKKTGIATATTAFKLVDSTANFITSGVVAGLEVRNNLGQRTIVQQVTATELTLLRDIMVAGQTYQIGSFNYGGADGQIMVQIPKFYIQQGRTFDGKPFWNMSLTNKVGFIVHPAFVKDNTEVDYRYHSAYEGSMFDISTGTMCVKASIATSLYAAGDIMCSVSGQWPKTNETKPEYRTMAATRGVGWRQLDYFLYSAVQSLYLVEYANFNSQAMIGTGRTILSGGSFVADSYIGVTGLSNHLGNSSGAVQLGGTSGYLTDYMSYRGIENLFGNVWKMVDGWTVDGRWTGAPAAMPMYVTNDSSKFADNTDMGVAKLIDASYIGSLANYITDVENCIGFIPSAVGDSSTIKIADYYAQYSAANNNFWRTPIVGGRSNYGVASGVFALLTHFVWLIEYEQIGSRLSF